MPVDSGAMRCPVCGQPTVLESHGIVAPFITELVENSRANHATELRACLQCGLTMFGHRYSDQELDAIYSGYRGDRYLQTRRKWEPWYRSVVNDAFIDGSPAVDERVRFMEEIISKSGRSDFALAVDFGGDGGQFFPSHCSGRRVIIDVSDKPVPESIERFASFADLDEQADLIMICHVLEHLNSPDQVLEHAHATMSPQGFLYVEVPLDRPKLHAWHSSARYGKYLNHLSRSRLSFVAADFLSGVFRQLGFKIPRLGVVKQSEHINYFNAASLQTLLRNAGFSIVASKEDERASVGGLRLGKLGILAQPV